MTPITLSEIYRVIYAIFRVVVIVEIKLPMHLPHDNLIYFLNHAISPKAQSDILLFFLKLHEKRQTSIFFLKNDEFEISEKNSLG